MIVCRDYSPEKRLDRVWYNSSNVIYSECDDIENDYKTLRVVFKNGKTYQYDKVDVNDYVLFIKGGLDGSNGKALNKFIIPKYDCLKLDDTNIETLNEEMENIKKAQKEEITEEK